MRSIMASALLVLWLLPASLGAGPAQGADCEFILGFKTLHDTIPNVVGNCLDNARFDAGLGEALQVTTGTRTDGGFGGILVWRQVDNLAWFSNGVNTWVNGPAGVQQRLSTQLFPWELGTLVQAAYNVDNMPFVLNQGKAQLMEDTPQVVRLTATLDQTTVGNIAYGDLNGDGVPDAAVRLIVNTGGSGDFNYLVAMVSNDGQASQAAATLLGDRVQVQSISITNGLITVKMLTQGPNDPFCCPTVPQTLTFRLMDGELVRVSA